MLTLALRIHTVRLGEVDRLCRLSIQTFKETFEVQNTAKDMQAYIEKQLNLEQLTSELLNQESYKFHSHIAYRLV